MKVRSESGGIRAVRAILVLAAAAAASGCASVIEDMGYIKPQPTIAVAEDEEPLQDGWDSLVTEEDRSRLARIDEAWDVGLATANGANFQSAVDGQGELLDPGAALPAGAPTPGSYRCRLVKLGAAKEGDPVYIAYQPFFCYISLEGDNFTIVKQTGTQRPAGRLYPLDDKIHVYLGSMALGNEREPLAYGDDPERDMAGHFERVGPFKWRLVIPYPRSGGILDVFELTPTIDQPE